MRIVKVCSPAGTITHAAQTVTATNAFGEWVPQHRILLQGSNITVATGGKLLADYLGYSTGAGPGVGSGGQGGAGHAGPGRRGNATSTGGPAYGSADDPWQPGSSGGAVNANNRPGGGAIRVQATGRLTVDGSVTAHGQAGVATHGCGGSGGSIRLDCCTIQGAGVIGANGGSGDRQGPGGSGGRIAVYYDQVAQAALLDPRPPLKFITQPGTMGNTAEFHPAALGTLYLPDALWMAETLDGQRFRHTRMVIPGWTHWATNSLALNDCIIGLPNGFHLEVTGALTLTNNAGLHVYPAPVANPKTQPGSRVDVGGNLALGSGCWIFPWADETNGATVVFTVGGNMTVASGGGFDADYKGYQRAKGPGSPANSYGGGGYGGQGGTQSPAQSGGGPYGDADVPVEAGSGGGLTGGSSSGGGAIRILVGGAVTLQGLLTANGDRGAPTTAPGGSDGAVFLTAGQQITGSGTNCANGGEGDRKGCSGGGGRIAVWSRIPVTEAMTMMTAQTVSNMHPDEHPSLTFFVAPGVHDTPAYRGDEGTVRYYSFAPLGTVIFVR